MTYTEKHIADSYSLIFNGLNYNSKKELTNRLTKSLMLTNPKADLFYKSFGAFFDEKTAEEIIFEIKENLEQKKLHSSLWLNKKICN
jgi:hypothetical protein